MQSGIPQPSLDTIKRVLILNVILCLSVISIDSSIFFSEFVGLLFLFAAFGCKQPAFIFFFLFESFMAMTKVFTTFGIFAQQLIILGKIKQNDGGWFYVACAVLGLLMVFKVYCFVVLVPMLRSKQRSQEGEEYSAASDAQRGAPQQRDRTPNFRPFQGAGVSLGD